MHVMRKQVYSSGAHMKERLNSINLRKTSTISLKVYLKISRLLSQRHEVKVSSLKLNYDYYETYYPNDQTLNGDVVFFEGDKESTFKRKSDEDIHYYENGYYNKIPKYDNVMYVKVTCDDNCDYSEYKMNECVIYSPLRIIATYL